MWDPRESNMMLQGQNMNLDPAGSEIHCLQGMRFPPPNNSFDGHFFAEASRKRKPQDWDTGHGGVSAGLSGNMGGNMGLPLPREYALQHNVALPPLLDSRMLFNRNLEHLNPSKSKSQYGAFQFINMDNSSVTSETKDANINKASFDSLRPFHHKESSFPVQTPQEFPQHHDSKHLMLGTTNRYDPSNFPSHCRQHSGLVEMSQVASRLDDGKTMGNGNSSIPYNPFLSPFSTPSNSMVNISSSSFRVFNENFHCDVGSFDQKIIKDGLEDGMDNSNIRTQGTEIYTFSEGRKALVAHQHHNTETGSGSSINAGNFSAGLIREQTSPPTSQMPLQIEYSELNNVPKVIETKLLERTEGSNTEDRSHPSQEKTLLGSGNSLASKPVEPDDGPPLTEKRTQSVAGKASPLAVEKLWDGSLQLSTCITVSVFAFFKSGEKAQGIKWSEHLEIKGKVKLQAFEKFIHELPRSRNRALMVISLCWKPGSPEAGLAGMKEVAKGYRESKRVGVAPICPNFDLYVCPRSDTIITILAKYGFFKGVGAVEDDQDSLIGCVIYRRSQTSSNPNPKISEIRKTLLNSLESSVPEINSPITQVNDSENKQEKAPSPLFSTSLDNKNIQSDYTPMPYNSPLVQVQPPASQKLQPTSLQEPVQPILSGPPQMLQGVQQQANFRNYNTCAPAKVVTLVTFESSIVRAQIPTGQNLYSNYRLNQMLSNLQPESPQPAPPGLPPFPPDIQHRILQFKRDAHKATTEGMVQAGISFIPTGEPQKITTGSDDDDDGDLPEFDFYSACGVPKPPTRFPRPHNDFQVPPAKSIDIRPTSHASGCQGPRTFREFNSSNQQIPEKANNKSSSSSSGFSKKSRWNKNDDDDDMPEWTPPILEHVHVPKPSPNAKAPVPEKAKEINMTPAFSITIHPPQSQSFSHEYHENMHKRFDHRNNLMRPASTNFSAKPPKFDASRQWKRH